MVENVVEGLARKRLGRTIKGKWRLDRLIGVGGMAAVYAATHRNGARVAIKMLHPTISESQQIRARFIREGYLANKVDHPGVVQVTFRAPADRLEARGLLGYAVEQYGEG